MENPEMENAPLTSLETLKAIKKSLEKTQTDEPKISQPPIKVKKTLNGKSFKQDKYSGLNLFNFNYEELPKLVEPIFPEVGVVSLVGSSDTGKSTLLRQLSLSIALGFTDFVGYKLNPKTRNVIYVSTEDDPSSTSISLKTQIKGLFPKGNVDEESLNHLKFIFDANLEATSKNNLFSVIERDLSEVGADLIIVDAFTDIFSGDINSSTKVREFLNIFNTVAKAHNCLVLFLHHTGKRTDKYSASKDNVLGSQAFEAKMRVLLELKPFPNDSKKRTLTITKGNYISSEIKKYSKILEFQEDTLLFKDTGQKVLSTDLGRVAKTNPNKSEMMPLIKKLQKQNKSVRDITSELKKQGFNIGKSSVSNYINELKSGNIIEKYY